MNPAGYRFEEKKEAGGYTPSPGSKHSSSSYRSTPSSRSSVLERAREYNRRIDEERSKSTERGRRSSSTPRSNGDGSRTTATRSRSSPRSTHERAMATVRRDTETLHHQPQQAPVRRDPREPAVVRSSETIRSQRSEGTKSRGESQGGGVPPELLVDALSGHEDGLLAIAEKLMEHYDSGYDVMGEAIIDAFADVQKLFQHVVEAAHMEGAAFEASRREETSTPTTPRAMLSRHDEFVDQDVKDVLSEAIRQGTILRNENKLAECARLFEQACQNASSLLPVDSDSRSRLQLSLDRAESMSPDRACAILRYTMDDVLRSGLSATPLPDPSVRQDMVLQRPPQAAEALTSLTEELRDILQAPIYDGTPLQAVARRFWQALAEQQTAQEKKEERLEQNLAKLKGEFLLARAEWEEKLNQANESAAKARESLQQQDSVDDDTTMYGSVRSAASRAETVASGVSGLARSLVNSQFSCAGTEPTDMDIRYEPERRRSRSRSKNTRSFREYSRSPHRVNV